MAGTCTGSINVRLPHEGISAGAILCLTALSLGIVGAVIFATKEKKPEYTLPKYMGG